ncbi:MAG TPA: phosphate ABC transporter permease subunit PstC [Actinomycetota bacterium]|jgi:phosphate transport system permease protein|nr:phosphate ABC transporter permease subunit PstC [Actinomycetota bacterium]
MATIDAPPEAAPATPLRRRRRFGDRAFRWTTLIVSVGLVVMLALLLWVLADGGWRAIREFGLHFIIGRDWNPVAGRETYGALPFIFGTVVTSLIAMVIAMPIGVGVALFLNESGSSWIKNPLAVLVDLLAAIPSVVYGIWGLFVLVPLFDHTVQPWMSASIGKVPIIGGLFTFNGPGGDIFTAGVILAIMILPIVTAVTREVVSVVSTETREGAMALGATRYETIRLGVLPTARPGIIGAGMLGLGRALGETIAVALVIGNSTRITASLFNPGYTIPAVIANEFREATSAGVHRSALLFLALLLVLIALGMATVSRLLVRRTTRLLGGDVAAQEEAATSTLGMA